MQTSVKQLHSLDCHDDEVIRLQFSRNGKLLASADLGIIRLWDAVTGRQHGILEDQDDTQFGMAFFSDGKWIASVSDDGNAQIWDVNTCKIEHTMNFEDESMLAVVFSPDSKLLATTSEVVRLWDTRTGVLHQTLLGPGDEQTVSLEAMWHRNEYPMPVTEVIFSPDGKKLVSACYGTNQVRVWNVRTWTLEHTIHAQTVKFSPDGSYLATAVNDYAAIQLHDAAVWELQSTIEGSRRRGSLHTFSPDGNLVAVSARRDVGLWDVKTGTLIKLLAGHEKDVHSIDFSPDGRILISGAGCYDVRIWNVETGDCLLMFEHKGAAEDAYGRCGSNVMRVRFGEEETKVALAFLDGSVAIWEVTWGGVQSND